MHFNLDGLFWLLLLLAPLLFLQRGLQRETQAIFLLLSRRADVAVVLFSILFFPGVLLHETSHFVMARLLGVRTGRFSLIPQPLPDGRLQLGFVETGSADWLRDSLIGVAPLISGSVFVAYEGLVRLGLVNVWDQWLAGGFSALPGAFGGTLNRPDFWLWFYLAVTVSSTMLPSASDRRAWLPITIIFVILLIVSLVFGAGPWLAANLSEPLNRALRAMAVVLGISILVHLVLLPPLWGIHRLISRLTGLDVA